MHIFGTYFRLYFYLFFLPVVLLFGCNEELNKNPTPPPIQPPSIFDWTFQRSDFPNNYTDIYFTNEIAGWVVGENNIILSTVDGGSNWPEAPVSSFEGNFKSVHLVNENFGWIAGDNDDAKSGGYVYLSINGGAYPEPQKTIEFPMNVVFSIDQEHGWAGGEQGQLLYTNDGGLNWNLSPFSSDISINGLYFIDQENGWACGTGGNLLTSTDGGISWQSEISNSEANLYGIHFIDSENGWACGEDNTLLKKEKVNGVLEWTKLKISSEPGNAIWRDIFFVNLLTGWVVGSSGAVYKTTDAGDTWSKESTGVFSTLNAIHMVSKSTGWIAGDKGVILTYTP